MASSTSAARPSSQASSTERPVMPTVAFLSSGSRDVGEAREEATLGFARERPQEIQTPTSASPPHDGDAMARFLPGLPAPSRDSVPLSQPLPSLSAMLLQNRMMGDYVFRKDAVQSQAATTVTTAFPPQDPFDSLNSLSQSEWEELLSGADRLENYVSPDISHVFDSQNKIQGSQELDMSGREFVSSPAIPVIGPVPRTFGDMLVPIRLLDPAHPRPDRQRSSRYSLRDKPRTAAISFESRVLLAPLRPLAHTMKLPGKSARTRLFGSPDTGEKENQPVNVELCATRAAHALDHLTRPKGNAGKKPISHGRRLLDGVIRTGKKPIGHGRRSLDSATPVNVPRAAPATSQSARRWKDCSVPGCAKGARSKGLCKRHGGGKRCSFPDCPRSDQGGGLCIGHGGGKRCTVRECSNSAQSRGLCKSHGGGKRCTVHGCTKSCQGGGFCRAHGGGTKRCKAPVCSNYCHTNGLCRIHSRDVNVYRH